MLRLQMISDGIEVEFSCEDSGEHVSLLNLLNSLIRELHGHQNVSLSIRSVEQEESEQEPDQEFPVRDE